MPILIILVASVYSISFIAVMLLALNAYLQWWHSILKQLPQWLINLQFVSLFVLLGFFWNGTYCVYFWFKVLVCGITSLLFVPVLLMLSLAVVANTGAKRKAAYGMLPVAIFCLFVSPGVACFDFAIAEPEMEHWHCQYKDSRLPFYCNCERSTK